MSYTDGRVADVNSVVSVGRQDVELQNVVDVGRFYVQRTQTLHHSGLAAEQLKHTGGNKEQQSDWSFTESHIEHEGVNIMTD